MASRCRNELKASGGKRVLFVGDRDLDPPRDGSAVVYRRIIEALSASGFRVSALFFLSDGTASEPMRSYLQRQCEHYLVLASPTEGWLGKILLLSYRAAFGTPFIPRWLGAVLSWPQRAEFRSFAAVTQFDLVIVSKARGYSLVSSLLATSLKCPVFVDLHDDYVARESAERATTAALVRRSKGLFRSGGIGRQRLRQMLYRLVPERARQGELRLLAPANRVLMSSLEEMRHYRAQSESAQRFVHLPWPLAQQSSTRRSADGSQFDAGFIGSSHPFNVEAAFFLLDHVLPVIKSNKPSFRLLIAGGVAGVLVRAGFTDPAVEYRSDVPDVADFYNAIALALVPLVSGTGVSIKTTEAVSYGRPVVATPIGVRGVELHHGKHLVVAADATTFAAGVLALLADTPRQRHLASAAAEALTRRQSDVVYAEAIHNLLSET